MDARAGAPESRRRGVLARLRPVDAPPEGKLETLLRALKTSNPRADLRLIERAYRFAEESHRDQYRASGERFIEHPLEVALILADLNLDTTTMVAALRHEVV
jgi:GTP pyrophosphokinase